MKKILNNNLGTMFFEVVEDKFKLYDSDENYIGYIETKSGFRNEEELYLLPLELSLIENITQLVEMGFCYNMMFNGKSKADLVKQFYDYGIEEEYFSLDDISLLDVVEYFDLEICRIGNYYFIMEYNEYF